MEIAGIYDNGPIQPICQIKQNLAIFTGNEWHPYKVDFYEGIPQSSPFIIDMVTLANAGVPIPANGQVQKAIVPILQVNDLELIHLRWEPLDDVEGGLWQLNNMARYAPRGGQAMVSPFSADRDPWLCETTFYILGINKDVNIGAFNRQAVAQPMARFAFWGFRYVLKDLDEKYTPKDIQENPKLAGKLGKYKALDFPITYLPAQGM